MPVQVADARGRNMEQDINDDDTISSSGFIETSQMVHGIVASDGVLINPSATGHFDLDELHAHQKTLHTALYADAKEFEYLETEYQTEFDDVVAHIPFSHPAEHHHHILDLPPVHEKSNHDPYSFHHSEGDTEEMLLKGIDIAQMQNDEGLVRLYRGQIMCNAGNYIDAVVQLEKSLEFYRHLHLSSCGDENSRQSSHSSHTRGSRQRGKMAAEAKDTIEYDTDTDHLDLCPHIYSILVEAYYNLQRFHRAASVAKEWLEKYPKNISPYCSLAWVYLQQQQYSDCINLCTLAIRKLPETEGMMTLYSLRGQCLNILEKYEEAVKDFSHVREMASKNLHRFAPEKPTFFFVDKLSRQPFPRFTPCARPDLAMRIKYGTPLPTPNQSVAGSQRSGQAKTASLSPPPKAASSHKPTSVNKIRNYEVRRDVRRSCEKCEPKRDPKTRLSVTQMRVGRSTDNRRGASPARLLLLSDATPTPDSDW